MRTSRVSAQWLRLVLGGTAQQLRGKRPEGITGSGSVNAVRGRMGETPQPGHAPTNVIVALAGRYLRWNPLVGIGRRKQQPVPAAAHLAAERDAERRAGAQQLLRRARSWAGTAADGTPAPPEIQLAHMHELIRRYPVQAAVYLADIELVDYP